MCQKMKKPVNVDSNEKGSGRKAHDKRMVEADKILARLWREKGLLDERNLCTKRGSNDEPANKVVLPPGIEEDMLRERGVRYDGCFKPENGVVTEHHFTITDTNKKSILSTITVGVMDDSDIISMLDIKLKSVA